MPYRATAIQGKYDFDQHPNFARIAKAAAEAGGVKEYLASDKCFMKANPMSLPEA